MGGQAGDGVAHLHRVPHGVDVRQRGLHPLVHHDAALDAQLQPGGLGQGGVRGDADGQHHHVRPEGRLVLQQHLHAPFRGGKTLHRVAQHQAHPVLAQFGVEEGGHLRVQLAEQMAGPLDDGDLQPQLPQVFRQLQPDEAAAGENGRAGAAGV